MQTKTITYKDAEVTAELVVARANYRMGLVHSSLIDAARERLFPKPKPTDVGQGETPPEKPTTYSEEFWIQLFSYPALCAGTQSGFIVLTEKHIDSQGNEASSAARIELDLHHHLTFEQYDNNLPDQLVTEWENAVFELNPHWLPAKPAEEQKKVAESSTPS